MRRRFGQTEAMFLKAVCWEFPSPPDGWLQSYLEDGDGADGDQDHHPHVHFGGELSAVVGVVVLVVLLRMVQHVVVVPPGVLILHTHTHTHMHTHTHTDTDTDTQIQVSFLKVTHFGACRWSSG